jgi:hypothetical protein
MTISTPTVAALRFALYGSLHPVPVVAELVARAVPVPLEKHVGWLRGTYYRWTGSDTADVLVQKNVSDEAGCPVEPEHPADRTLVYATALDDAGYAALARVDGLRLLQSDTLQLAWSHSPVDATCR